MKRMIFSLSCAVLALTGMAQKVVQDPLAEKRSVRGFHGISVSGGIDLYLSQGNESVVVSASEARFRDHIKTEVKDGILSIWFENTGKVSIAFGSDRKMKAYVSFKELDKLTASGGSDIDVDGSIKVSTLVVHISGGSDFHGKVDAGDLNIETSGGSDADISGTAKRLNITNTGGSDFKGYGMVADVCDLNASGGGEVYITVNKELKANTSGGSDVYYKGNATLDQHSSGSSSVKKISR